MGFLQEWITHVLLFILLAMVVELLLPKSGLQKYVKMVLGLLLMIIILTPIIRLFNLDIESLTSGNQEFIPSGSNKLENSLENKKVEIQAEQHAYILEQTAVQLKEMTEKELIDAFGYEIENIHIEGKNDSFQYPLDYEQMLANIESIHVLLIQKNEENLVKPVQKVQISTENPSPNDPSEKEMEKMIEYLSRQWGVEGNIIAITIKGGKAADG